MAYGRNIGFDIYGYWILIDIKNGNMAYGRNTIEILPMAEILDLIFVLYW